MKIAITFSGGGYRAAGFSLGTLSYLYLIPFKEKTLGDQIMVLSTVSGGTITGSRYALGLQRNENIQTIFQGIYDFLADTQLVQEALGNLSNDNHWQTGRIRSLITSFADVYSHSLFKGALFDEIMSSDEQRQLKHVSFNATEFANGAQFRFQWSEKIFKPSPGEKERGIIGNFYFPLPEEIARRLRMGDIVAASSCFPAGFEPINFPGDFLHQEDEANWMNGMSLPVGLMDGGIVDNQGIDPVLLAEQRMQRNRLPDAQETQVTSAVDPEIDLILISDVASPFMKSYQASKENKKGWFRNMQLLTIVIVNAILTIVAFGIVIWTYRLDSKAWLLGSTVALTLFSTLFLALWFIGRLPQKFKVPKEFLKPLRNLLRLPIYVYESLIFNRVNSFKMLALNVFLKHTRTMNYDTIYQDARWQNRRIMCAVYELKTDEIQKRQNSPNALSTDLVPSKALMDLVDKAANFSTTLWFTEDDTKAEMLDALIACGQATACWNLLEYIEKLKMNLNNTNKEHQLLVACEPQIRRHWEILQADPFALLFKNYLIRK